MNKFTPGPWFVGEETWTGDGAGGVLVETKDGCIVAFCTCWTDAGEPDRTQPENYADAKLIACAPDLLAALEAVVAIADRDTDVFINARAVIAKARGDS